MTPYAFEFKHITKAFGPCLANDGVSFPVHDRSIHGIVGENGAGKSTIMKMLYGLFQPDAGEIWVRGRLSYIRSPHDAIGMGIGMVHQHFMLVPTLSVWQNIILGKEGKRLFFDKHVIEKLDNLQKDFGLSLDLNATIEMLPVGQQQQAEILKMLYREAEILILDEPTAVLTPQEVTILFANLKALWEKGKTIVLISHKLGEILEFTERVTVMRKGKVVASHATKDLSKESLGEMIVGRKIFSLPTRLTFKETKEVLSVTGLHLRKRHRAVLDQLTFNIREGEILGVAGVSGNGQQELCEVLSNIERDYEGEVRLFGKPLKTFSTYGVRQEGLSVIPPDRQHEGLILSFTVRENFLLGHHRQSLYTRGIWISRKKTQPLIESLLERFDVRPRNPALPVSALSGGNQQKVIIGREMATTVKFLVASHPTRGVDIGATQFIHSLFLKAREAGAAMVLISSELDEILELSDRIIVLFEGKIMGEIDRAQATESLLGRWMMGAK